ncbi:Protein synthesis factor [Penicillium brevicompactum]
MASIFTYDPDPPRVSSPWSTSGSSTPQVPASASRGLAVKSRSSTALSRTSADLLSDYGISKLEPEPQEGPTEYKLHLLLRPRRSYISISTGNLVAGSFHHRALTSTSASPSSEPTLRPMQTRSNQSRQQRLQGLTTQLLWRLQQSSPFHSSTTSKLVVPVLPDAAPELGAPLKPARLLPGLEESQGALYEIGVADDGTFVGLTQDEVDESVSNLRTMAASLGCKVEILRRVVVGQCEWAEDSPSEPVDSTHSHTERLWVAEALVSPDLDFYNISQAKIKQGLRNAVDPKPGNDGPSSEDYSHTEQIRISLTGPSTAGKSSLLGALTSSALDNGRGKSRLSLLKHRHEISSGITSSVAQELIGYTNGSSPNVINYASGNVAGWDDIHAASKGGRLAFVSDLPGSVRYLKSTLRGLVSWAPHYVMLCIPANSSDQTLDAGQAGNEQSELETCLAYLELCLKLEVPVLIIITKMDLASRSGLRDTLARVLSTVKSAGRQSAILPTPPVGDKPVDLQQISDVDSLQAQKAIAAAEGKWAHTVPILLTSAVDGSGIGKLHAFLRSLPIPARPSQRIVRVPNGVPMSPYGSSNIFDVDEVFAIPPSKVYSIDSETNGQENRGMVLCGLVRRGSISIGDEMVIGPILVDTTNDSSQEAQTPGGSLSRSGPGPSGDHPASLPQSLLSGKDPQAKWQRIRVVSVRDLRLPVRRLVRDQVGTIGIEPVGYLEDGVLPRFGRIRKGMVLSDFHVSTSGGNEISPAPALLSLPFHTGFTATFRSAEFSAPNSPPLLLGGNAIAYVANVRTTVRVICMALAGTGEETSSEPSSPSEPEFFNFDGDSHLPADKSNPTSANSIMSQVDCDGASDSDRRRSSAMDISKVVSGTASASIVGTASSAQALKEDVKITFAFVSSVEWLELGSQVIVMPGTSVTPASSQTGATVASAFASGSNSTPTSISGLEGFVGTVSDVIPGRAPISSA